jgi:hypothetical protein
MEKACGVVPEKGARNSTRHIKGDEEDICHSAFSRRSTILHLSGKS